MSDKYDAFSDEDMADVGRALMRAIDAYMPDSWHPMDCPSEVVGDLSNKIDELKADLAALQGELAKCEAINAKRLSDKDEIIKRHQDTLMQAWNDKNTITCEHAACKLDAERYKFLRLDDNWCEDATIDWAALGELSGSEFDEAVDAAIKASTERQ